MTELQKRIITGVVGTVVLFFIIIQGGLLLEAALFLISLEAIRELSNAFKAKDIHLNNIVLVIGAILLFLFQYFNISLEFSIIFVLLASIIILLFDEKYTLNDITYTVFSFIYAPYLFNLLYGLKQEFIFLVFVIAFSTDTFAYFVGMTFGKHKLIPKVSPKKSVEGAVGGIVCCLILTLVYFYFMNLPINAISVIFIIISSIAGQIGDLIASKIKRVVGIKDYAKILPGHGGILDRFDSTLMVIPFVYILQFFLFN